MTVDLRGSCRPPCHVIAFRAVGGSSLSIQAMVHIRLVRRRWAFDSFTYFFHYGSRTFYAQRV